MSEVLLTVRNPDDGSVTPVAGNEFGELLVQAPGLNEYVQIEGDNMTGDLTLGGDKITFGAADGSADFAGNVTINSTTIVNGPYQNVGTLLCKSNAPTNTTSCIMVRDNTNTDRAAISANGAADFSGDVVVGSRNQKWMLVESGGLCHMISQTRMAQLAEAAKSEGETQYPELRDVLAELTMVEQHLQLVMETLKMAPQAGWEVWDGSE